MNRPIVEPLEERLAPTGAYDLLLQSIGTDSQYVKAVLREQLVLTVEYK